MRFALAFTLVLACERTTPTDAPAPAFRPPPPPPSAHVGLPDIPCPSRATWSSVGFLLAALVPEQGIGYAPNRVIWWLDTLLLPPQPCAGQCCWSVHWTP